MTFEDCVEFILKVEGGYVNNPKDPGQETNFGISKKAYPELNIRSLTRDQAKQIYRRDYWEKFRIESLPENLRLIYFDCAVNQGPARARMIYMIAQKSPQSVLQAFTQARLDHYMSLGTWEKFGAGWTKRLIDVLFRSVNA